MVKLLDDLTERPDNDATTQVTEDVATLAYSAEGEQQLAEDGETAKPKRRSPRKRKISEENAQVTDEAQAEAESVPVSASKRTRKKKAKAVVEASSVVAEKVAEEKAEAEIVEGAAEELEVVEAIIEEVVEDVEVVEVVAEEPEAIEAIVEEAVETILEETAEADTVEAEAVTELAAVEIEEVTEAAQPAVQPVDVVEGAPEQPKQEEVGLATPLLLFTGRGRGLDDEQPRRRRTEDSLRRQRRPDTDPHARSRDRSRSGQQNQTSSSEPIHPAASGRSVYVPTPGKAVASEPVAGYAPPPQGIPDLAKLKAFVPKPIAPEEPAAPGLEADQSEFNASAALDKSVTVSVIEPFRAERKPSPIWHKGRSGKAQPKGGAKASTSSTKPNGRTRPSKTAAKPNAKTKSRGNSVLDPRKLKKR